MGGLYTHPAFGRLFKPCFRVVVFSDVVPRNMRSRNPGHHRRLRSLCRPESQPPLASLTAGLGQLLAKTPKQRVVRAGRSAGLPAIRPACQSSGWPACPPSGRPASHSTCQLSGRPTCQLSGRPPVGADAHFLLYPLMPRINEGGR